jgi:2-methylisocitrate lyase-like PEP mutase family enzyme
MDMLEDNVQPMVNPNNIIVLTLSGFEGLYISGAAITASSGVPDIGYRIYNLCVIKNGNTGWFL